MRCREVRRKLTEIRDTELGFIADRELREHLRNCPACAKQAQAAIEIQQSLKDASISDNNDAISWSALKARVEAQVAHNNRLRTEELPIMSRITNKLRKPGFSLSLGAVTLALVLFTLIPFKFESTVGYEVAFAGVDRNLALDNNRLTQLLSTLGCDEASFDVSDCEATCKVKISELKSEFDVQLIVAAFDELGNCTLENISEIHGDAPTTLFKHAKNVITLKDVDINSFALNDNEEMHEYIVQCIGELSCDSSTEFNIWVWQDSCLPTGSEPDSDIVKSFTIGGTSFFSNQTMIKVLQSDADDQSAMVYVTTTDGEEHQIDLRDEDAEEQLQALGLNMQMLHLGDGVAGEKQMIIQCIDTTILETADDSDDSAEKESASEALPEGFNLAQNYPNPFNPTTQIEYTLLTSQHVTLEIYNINGQLVKTLADEVAGAGTHSVEWDATSNSGDQVTTGVYFYRLTAGDITETKKMSFLK